MSQSNPSSRDAILGRLRAARQPFTDVPPIEESIPVVPLADTSTNALRQRFKLEAETLGCKVYEVSEDQALDMVIELVGGDSQVLSWDAAHIPLNGYTDALNDAGIKIADPLDNTVRVGITGADAGLAGTGSLVMVGGAGKYRTTSLLPDRHIAILRQDRLLPGMESWIAQQREQNASAFHDPANTVLITGPSKTADIAQELIKGAHGPREVHIVLVG
jgi:L-lactate dehydrogenase complex protein LldG